MQLLVLERSSRLRPLSLRYFPRKRSFSTVSQRIKRSSSHPRPNEGACVSLGATYNLQSRRTRLTPLIKLQQRSFAIIDSDIYEPDTLKTRFYNVCHRTAVLILVSLCVGGICVVIFLSVKLHTQGKKVKMAAMRSRYLKDLLRQHRVLVPFNEANMDMQPLQKYYEPMLHITPEGEKTEMLKFYDLVEEPIYGTIANKFNQAGYVFDWLLSGETHIEDYCLTLAMLTYFARQPMRDETTKRIRTIGDEFYKMLMSWNKGTENEGKVVLSNVCAFAGACFGTGLAAPPHLGGGLFSRKMSYREYRETYIKTLLGDMGLQMNSEVTRKMFSKVHGNMQYHLGLIPKKAAKNRRARQI